MDIQRLDLSPETILQRIDTILRELEALRKMVAHTCVEPATDDPTQHLSCAAKHRATVRCPRSGYMGRVRPGFGLAEV
jgi:hypothetical protein